jgi:hypothetical protein
MRAVAGYCRGTGQILNLCIGFVPDFVNIYNFGDAGSVLPVTIWNKHFSADACLEGYTNDSVDGNALADHTQAEGIQPYLGGYIMDSVTQPSTTYGASTVDCFTWDTVDYRYQSGTGPHPRTDATGATIDTWTLDTKGSYTGSFNALLTGTYTGAGSRIQIDGHWYTITVASTETTADDVELSMDPINKKGELVYKGAIQFITGMYGTCGYPVALGAVSKPGFKLAAISTVNEDTEMFSFEAGTYDSH